MKKISAFVILILLVLLVACTNKDRSRETLEKAGYTDINLGGYDAFSCSDSDTYATKFTARNPNGMRVSGVVCCGLTKSCTIRF